jgi:membrane protease YdiL (CAAX protease family)
MQLFNSYKDRNCFFKLVLKIVVVLALIQLFRVAIFGSLWWLVNPENNITLFQIINGLDYLIVGILLLLCFKPSLNDIGLNPDDMILRTRIFYGLAFLLMITLIIIPYLFEGEPHILILGLVFGLITPIFEEILFRGYIWGKISQSPGMVNSPRLTLGTVTLLFMIWHLGYLDVLILHPLATNNIPGIMISKMGIGLVLGLIVGYLRLKTGKTYLSILFHGLWNVFAP